MKEFLAEYPLYKEYLLVEDFKLGNENYYDPSQFKNITFKYFCEKEQDETIFNLKLEKSNHFNTFEYKDKIPDFLFQDGKLNFIFLSISECQSCRNSNLHLLLHVYSDNPISNILNNVRNITLSEQQAIPGIKSNIYIQKIGMYPEQKFVIDKNVKKFLDKESNTFYFKGLKALNQNLGVGAFSYFRRIIERELLHIVNEIKNLPNSESSEIQLLLDKYEKAEKVSTIYENIFPYLPATLKELNYNPIMLLYNQTSEGLHKYTEEEALKRADHIKNLLEFVIIKINEEKSTIKNMKDIVKALRDDQG